jgi:tRNA threonylcarbamoyladenosine biosynthesis protein TsaB
MLILGIDTAGRRSGVALLEDDAVLAARSGDGAHSATLLPMIAAALGELGRAPSEIGLVGVARGPGTYTGLRVGVVTAKALGRATGATVLGVPTLGALASQAPASTGPGQRTLVALHAYKRRFLCVWFERGAGGELLEAGPPTLCNADQVPSPGPGAALVTDALELLPALDAGAVIAPTAEGCAATVARLARDRLAAGAADETYALAPVYLKPPPVTLRPERRPPGGCGEEAPR